MRPFHSLRNLARLLLLCGVFLSLFVIGKVDPAFARPSAMRIFPKETLAFLRIAHAREAFEKTKESSFGRMFEDPEIRPFFEHLYNSATSAFDEYMQQQSGLTIDEFLQIPQGEMAAGLIARKNNKPTFAFLIELGEESTAAHKLLDRILEAMVAEGAAREVETIGELEATIVRIDDDFIEAVVFIERENTLIIAADMDLGRQMLALWDAADGTTDASAEELSDDSDNSEDDSTEGSSDNTTVKKKNKVYWTEPLAENPQFIAVMRHCRTPGDAPPDMIGFADPIEIFRSFAHGEAGMSIAVATLKPLGLDGIRAVGYSATLASDTYQDVTHMHLLLDNPRAGVLSLFNVRTGDLTPEPWVPDDVETYISGYWEVPLTYDKLIALYDQFQYKGAFEKNVERDINEPAGLDLRKEFIDQAAGRLTMLTGFQKPALLRPRAFVLAIQVHDEDAVRATIEKLIALEPDEFEERTFGSEKYWVIVDALNENVPEAELPASPCFGLMDGYVIFSLATQSYQACIAARDGTVGRLVDTEDYLELADHLSRQGAEPGAVLVSRPKESMRYLYDLATSDHVREQISEGAANNPLFGILENALTEAPLPPFEVIAKYFPPAGGLVTDSETGFHFVSFTLRRDE